MQCLVRRFAILALVSSGAAAQVVCPPDIVSTSGYVPPTVIPNLEHVADCREIASGFALKDEYLYLMEPSRLLVFDVSNPAEPDFVTWKRLPASFQEHVFKTLVQSHTSLHVAGDILVIVREQQMGFFDISEPSCPELIQATGADNLFSAFHDAPAIAASDGLLLVPTFPAIRVIDLSNPAFPVRRYSYETDTSYLHVTLRGTIAFMADGEILDFEDPAQPVSLGSIPAHDASAIDGNLLVTGSADNDSVELSVFDVDLFGGTTARGHLALGHDANVSSLGRILLRDATAYITVGDEWWIIDLSDRDNPVRTATAAAPEIPDRFLQLHGDYLYAGGKPPSRNPAEIAPYEDSEDGAVAIIDFSDPTNLNELWHYTGYRSNEHSRVIRGYQFQTQHQDEFPDAGMVYFPEEECEAEIGDFDPRLKTLQINDVRDPKMPLRATSFPGRVFDFELVDTTLYATMQFSLRLYDASVPGDITEIGCMDAPGNFGTMAKSGNGLYFYGNPTVHTTTAVPAVIGYDVSAPEQPQYLFQYEMTPSDFILELIPVGEHTIVMISARTLHVVDVSNPTAPQFASSYFFLDEDSEVGKIEDLEVYGTVALLACGQQGVHAVDFSDPYNLELIDTFEVEGIADPILYIQKFVLYEDELFAFQNQSEPSLVVLDVSDPSDLAISRRTTELYARFHSYGSYRLSQRGHIFRDTSVPLGQLAVQGSAGNVGATESTFSYAAELTGAIEGAEIFAEVTEGGEWLEVIQGAYLIGSGEVHLRALANESSNDRTATLTVFAPEAANAPVTIQITQPSPKPAELVVSQDEIMLGAAGGALDVNVDNAGDIAMPWSAALDPPVAWLQITAGASGVDEGAVSLTCAANPTTEPRATTLVITAPGAAGSPIEVPISQGGLLPAGLVVTPDMQTVGAAAGSVDIAISNPGDMPLNWTAQLTGGAWIRIEGADSGVDDGSLSIAYDENTNTTQRTAVVTITGNGGELSALAVIRQAAAEDSNTEVPGDLDGDDLVNAVDIQLIINAVLEGDADPKFDVNNDGTVDAADIQLIINAALEA